MNDRGYLSTTHTGITSTTLSGKTCQKWTDQFPHQHDYSPEEYPGTGIGNHNYCRDPFNDSEGAWCYTTDPDLRWEYCTCGTRTTTSPGTGTTPGTTTSTFVTTPGDMKLKHIMNKKIIV